MRCEKKKNVRNAKCEVDNFDIDIMKHREILCDNIAILTRNLIS